MVKTGAHRPAGEVTCRSLGGQGESLDRDLHQHPDREGWVDRPLIPERRSAAEPPLTRNFTMLSSLKRSAALGS